MNKVSVTIRISADMARTAGDVVWDMNEVEFSGFVDGLFYIPAFLRDSATRLERAWAEREKP